MFPIYDYAVYPTRNFILPTNPFGEENNPALFNGIHSPFQQNPYLFSPMASPFPIQPNHWNQQPFVPALFDHPLYSIYKNNPLKENIFSKLPPQNAIPPFFPPVQQNGMHMILNSFKNKDGSIDFNKLTSIAGQMVQTLNQLSSFVKGFSQLFKA